MSDTTKQRAGITVPTKETTNNGNGAALAATNATSNGNETAPTNAAANGSGAVAPASGDAKEEAAESPTPRRADQDQKIAALISGTAKVINLVLTDPDIYRVMAKRSFKKEKLNKGLGLCGVAQAQWDARQVALGCQTECTDVVTGLFDDEVKAYSDFRETARAELKDEASLRTLSVLDAVPDDFDKFLTHARGAYNCAKKEPYVSALGEYGYDEEGLEERLKALDALEKADREQSRSLADAQKATRMRDDAATPVRAFRNQLLKVARRAFRKDPEQARKLEI